MIGDTTDVLEPWGSRLRRENERHGARKPTRRLRSSRTYTPERSAASFLLALAGVGLVLFALLATGCAPDLTFYRAERATYESLAPFVEDEVARGITESTKALEQAKAQDAPLTEFKRHERRIKLLRDHLRTIALWGMALDDWKVALGE